MQVHKETIDKVPNSLPHRGNIEIEIYGMEGIPDADLKAHESGRDDDDEPGAKRAKSDSPALGPGASQPIAGQKDNPHFSRVFLKKENITGPQIPAGYQLPGQGQVQMVGVPGMPGLVQPAASIGLGVPGYPGIRQPFLAAGMAPG